MAKRSGDFHADHAERRDHHMLDGVKNVFLARERHLEVELRELELPVRAKILVANALADLEIAVHSRNHKNLLEDLRRLRERVELAVMNPAWDEAVARAFGRRARQERRFDLEETEIVERLAHGEDDLVAQLNVAVELRTAQVEVAIAQTCLFAGGHFVFNLEWRRFGVV